MFQSLIGIIDNWNENDKDRAKALAVFQSLIGIIDNWNLTGSLNSLLQPRFNPS